MIEKLKKFICVFALIACLVVCIFLPITFIQLNQQRISNKIVDDYTGYIIIILLLILLAYYFKTIIAKKRINSWLVLIISGYLLANCFYRGIKINKLFGASLKKGSLAEVLQLNAGLELGFYLLLICFGIVFLISILGILKSKTAENS